MGGYEKTDGINYPQLKYLGIINIEDKLFLRTSLTAPLSKITPLKMEILDKYYEK